MPYLLMSRMLDAARVRSLSLLLCAGIALLATGCDDADAEPAAHANLRGESFLLVHGAWNGAWVWDEMKELLEAEGATVRTLTLPGHAEDMTPVGETSLASYVDAVLTVMQGMGRVTLVGHSFGGVVISLTAERAPERIKQMIYVGAFLPQDGETALGLAQTDTDSDLGPALDIDMQRGVVSIERTAFPSLFCADCGDAELAILADRYSDEPLPALVESIVLTQENFGGVPKYYVYTEQDRVLSPAFQRRVSSRVQLIGTASLQTSHCPFFASPYELMATMDELLGR